MADGRARSATAGARHVLVTRADGPHLLDLRTGRSTPVGPPDAQAGGGALAAKGRALTFTSAAPDLVGDDTNGEADVFVRHTR
ncbi:hypothetical protein RB200_26140 [Streptomyces sp. PmtG]